MITKQDKLTYQLILGIILAVAGLVLIFTGMWIEPIGEIHNSVLIAFGEVSTFSGALIGVDYRYSYQRWKDRQIRKIEEDNYGREEE